MYTDGSAGKMDGIGMVGVSEGPCPAPLCDRRIKPQNSLPLYKPSNFSPQEKLPSALTPLFWGGAGGSHRESLEMGPQQLGGLMGTAEQHRPLDGVPVRA